MIKNLHPSKYIAVAWLVAIQWVISYEWLHSAWGKFTKPEYMDSIAKTLTVFAQKSTAGWYGSFLESTALPRAELFGNIVRYSELLAGLTLLIGGLVVLVQKPLSKLFVVILMITCFGGALLSLNFYLASSWSGPSGAGLNTLMGLIQLILGIYYASLLRSGNHHN